MNTYNAPGTLLRALKVLNFHNIFYDTGNVILVIIIPIFPNEESKSQRG